MTVELRPLGVSCNLACTYCYQNPQRDARNLRKRYDLNAMMAALEKQGGPFTLFGGEPLSVPEEDLEILWSWGYQKFGANGIQTNGSLINENHIRMFKAYKVHVGISIDGPSEFNDARWAGGVEITRKKTAATQTAIERLCEEGLEPSLIVTLSRTNAASDKLPHMGNWFRQMDSLGIASVRLHLLEIEDETVRAQLALSEEDNVLALEYFESLNLPKLRFDVYQDMRRMLMGQDNHTTCVWNACDPYTTRAVQGVEGLGQKSNCGRTNKDGIDFVKADQSGFERYIALYETPQTEGGCHNCRFFLMCKGHCPGTAIGGDWRNRTEHCQVWKTLYADLERKLVEEGITPLSSDPLRSAVEQHLLEGWLAGENRGMQPFLKLRGWLKSADEPGTDSGLSHGDSHGDHYDG